MAQWDIPPPRRVAVEGPRTRRTLQISRPISAIVVVLVLILGLVAGLALSRWKAYASQKVPIFIARTPASIEAATTIPKGFAPVVKPVLPAVVNISTSRVVKTPFQPFLNNPFLAPFFGGRLQIPRARIEHSLGSGVVVSPDGYILTNNHVVDQASDIKVTLSDKRELKAKLVGTDPKTDVAVLNIPATGLATLTLGDSSKAEVGDYVLAVGDPFGLAETVTQGIVSATGRGNLDIEDYEDFIQTDAPINPGNSGGALINTRSELIGINTAILAGAGGGNQGIGFAIPSNMASYVMQSILQHGKVIRGYLGVAVQELTPALAKTFNAPNGNGVVVADVDPNGPAAKAGLKKGDVIEAVNGKPITAANQFRLLIASTPPGTSTHLKVSRNGQEHDIAVTLGELPEKSAASAPPATGDLSPLAGVEVEDLTPHVAHQLGLRPGTKGVVITDVAPGSPADEAGLRRGDVIEEINRQPVNSAADFQRIVQQARDQQLVLSVNREGTTGYVEVG